jgi:hypothetical protein
MKSVELQRALTAIVVVVAAIVVVRFEMSSRTDLARSEEVRYLSKPAWAAICILSIPLGGILYPYFGRTR